MSMMRRALTPCDGCPFHHPSNERAQLVERADQGGWVPCKHTVGMAEGFRTFERVAVWHAEEECAGARLWRRDRQFPPATLMGAAR